jgi:histidinol-phosphatase (PHP family)
MLKIDYHLHSSVSADAHTNPDALVKKAIARGYEEIAITDHFDLLPSEISTYGVPSYRQYIQMLESLQARYPEIHITSGMEAGELHRVKDLLMGIIAVQKPDLLIGSIHVLSTGKNISVPFSQPLTDAEIQDYYQENLHLVQSGDFQVLGHLGIYKRYYHQHPGAEDKYNELVAAIFEEMIKRDIALEINYSGLRKTLKSLIPEIPHLKLYLELGGKLLTLGSDAHTLAHFDDKYQQAIHLIRDLGVKSLARRRHQHWHDDIEI